MTEFTAGTVTEGVSAASSEHLKSQHLKSQHQKSKQRKVEQRKVEQCRADRGRREGRPRRGRRGDGRFRSTRFSREAVEQGVQTVEAEDGDAEGDGHHGQQMYGPGRSASAVRVKASVSPAAQARIAWPKANS